MTSWTCPVCSTVAVGEVGPHQPVYCARCFDIDGELNKLIASDEGCPHSLGSPAICSRCVRAAREVHTREVRDGR